MYEMHDEIRRELEEKHGLRLVCHLGRGGFAEVYKAETKEGVPCAVKISRDRIEENEAVRKEKEKLPLLQYVTGHPHVVTLIDYWEIKGYLVTCWEFAQEGTLLDRLKEYQRRDNQGIPLHKLLPWMEQAAEGIDFLNSNRFYHRDIKPQNLFLFHGQVKVGDLGLVKFTGLSTTRHSGAGTLGYLPPEHELSPTVDLYSLAATYVKLRTGREPFGETANQIVRNQLEGKVQLDGLPEPEAELLRRALSPDSNKRPQQGCQHFVEELRRVVLSEKPTRAVPVSTSPGSADAATGELPQDREPVAPSRVDFGGQPTQAVAAPEVDTTPASPQEEGFEETYSTVVAIRGAIGGAIAFGGMSMVYGAIEHGIGSAILGAICGVIGGGICGTFLGAFVTGLGGKLKNATEGAVLGAVCGAIALVSGFAVLGAMDDGMKGAIQFAVGGAVCGVFWGGIWGAICGAAGR